MPPLPPVFHEAANRTRQSTGTVVRLRQRPQIVVNAHQLRELIRKGWDAVLREHQPTPSLFVRRGYPVSLRDSDDGLAIQEETSTSLYGLLARAADWYRGSGTGLSIVKPVREVAQDMLLNPDPRLPRLESVSGAPLMVPGGRVLATPGYHREAAIYLDPARLVNGVVTPERPSASDVAAARTLILELVCDFPFVNDSDQAHFVAALLVPFVRRLIRGPTPLHFFSAPTAGSGKTLLADVISIVVTGGPINARSLPRDDDEIRRTLTAELSLGRPIILLDNLDSTGRRRMLHSPTLASILTAEAWTDRVIRTSRMITLPNAALWLGTGNRPGISTELVRRSVFCRLDPDRDEPWLRSSFRHPDLRGWVHQHRAELTRAALVLTRAWWDAGCPQHRGVLGSFEAYSRVEGGILEVVHISGFLGNLAEVYSDADVEGEMWREFVGYWWESYGSDRVRAFELNQLCEERELMVGVRGSGSERSQQTKLGLALEGAKGRVFRKYRVVRAKNRKGRLWQVVPVYEPPDGTLRS